MNTTGKVIIEGLKLIDPTVKGIDFIQALSEYVRDRNIERIDEINRKLLEDEVTEYEREKILSGGIDTEDYLSFIRAAVNEDENMKTVNYITLYRNILNNNVKENKSRLFKILKELPYSAIQLLSKIYIYKYYSAQSGTLESFLSSISIDDNLAYELNLLIQYGLLRNVPVNENNEMKIILSSTFESIVKSFFKEEELTPKYQNIPVWNKFSYIFLNLDNTDDKLIYFSNLLKNKKIKLVGNYNIYALDEYIPLKVDTIICLLDKKELSRKNKDMIKRYEKNYEIIKVCFDNSFIDQLNEIEGEVIYLKKNDKELENRFLSKFLMKKSDYLF